MNKTCYWILSIYIAQDFKFVSSFNMFCCKQQTDARCWLLDAGWYKECYFRFIKYQVSSIASPKQ